MPLPDQFQQIVRLKKKIAYITVKYQDMGWYEFDGKRYTNTDGIVKAMAELDALQGKITKA